MDPEDNVVGPLLAPTYEELSEVVVFPLIYRIKNDVIQNIDTALTWEQLRAPDVNFSIVKPLVAKYARLQNRAIIFAFLVVKSHFHSAAGEDLAFSALALSRASLCELLAMKLLREFTNRGNRMELVIVLTSGWNVLQGAPDQAFKNIQSAMGRLDDVEEPMSALELAITTESKYFIATPLVQEVVNEVWSGNVSFANVSTRSILADNYKSRQVVTYHDPRLSSYLDHYRLRVPKYRAIIEMFNFTVLLTLFVLCLANKDFEYAGLTEILFGIYTFGFVLNEFAASQEHGWEVYTANIWNGFDLAFIVLFIIYVGLRIKGLMTHDDATNDLAFDILSCGACILFPRVAFFFISNHVIVVALRAMMYQFALFIGVAAVCFSGILFTLWKISGPEWTFKKIAWLMTQIWFGNTYLSFNVAESFHPIFGPPLMVVYAALSNTLLITILISILSSTYGKIDQGATYEYLFQFAISTLEGVKSDALFSYQPPANIVAYLVLFPLSFVLSPRMFHTVNVLLIRLTSFPFLITIGIYERHFAAGSKIVEGSKGAAHAVYNSLPRRLKNVVMIEAIMGGTSSDVLDALFDVDMPENMLDDADSTRGPPRSTLQSTREGAQTPTPAPAEGRPSRGRLSTPASPGFRFQRSSSRTNELHFRIQPPPDSEQPNSPLAKMFSGAARGSSYAHSAPDLLSLQDDLSSNMRRMETLLETVQGVQKLRAELKEVKERSERMETLLLSLSKGARS